MAAIAPLDGNPQRNPGTGGAPKLLAETPDNNSKSFSQSPRNMNQENLTSHLYWQVRRGQKTVKQLSRAYRISPSILSSTFRQFEATQIKALRGQIFRSCTYECDASRTRIPPSLCSGEQAVTRSGLRAYGVYSFSLRYDEEKEPGQVSSREGQCAYTIVDEPTSDVWRAFWEKESNKIATP